MIEKLEETTILDCPGTVMVNGRHVPIYGLDKSIQYTEFLIEEHNKLVAEINELIEQDDNVITGLRQRGIFR